MTNKSKDWKGTLPEWIAALATAAAVVVAYVALREAGSASRQNIQVLNADKTPWLSMQGAGWGVDTSPASPTPLQYALNLTIENTGGGPALDADLSTTNSLGHTGEARNLALMPGAKTSVGVCYAQKARDRQQLREWLDSAYRPPDSS